MKKLIVLFICLFINIGIYAEEIKVEFSKCVDGDTARFIYNNEEITARFLAIDTPESVHPTVGEEEYGKTASDYTCESLMNAKEIVLEFDSNSDKMDKYDRYLVWVFVDGELLQKQLIQKGYAEVAYLYGDYKYTSELEKEQELAKNNKVGIWSLENTSTTVEKDDTNTKTDTNDNIEVNKYIVIIAIIILVIIFIFSKKGRKKIIRKTKSRIKKELRRK